jgi:hypothetical protein
MERTVSGPAPMAVATYGRHLLGSHFSASQPDVTMIRIQEERLKRHHSVPRHHQQQHQRQGSPTAAGERDGHRRKRCRYADYLFVTTDFFYNYRNMMYE